MKLEDQVVSLELAKKLRELGVKQNGHFIWVEHSILDRDGVETITPEVMQDDSVFIPSACAFTVAELGHLLPKYDFAVRTHFYGKQWIVCCTPIQRGIGAGMPSTYSEKADTEADARAKMVIYLIETKLMEAA